MQARYHPRFFDYAVKKKSVHKQSVNYTPCK
jgi:hypothetical protein